MKNKKEIINNSQYKKCNKCDGSGFINITDKFIKCGECDCEACKPRCQSCSGTGEYIDSHFIIIDKKSKIAIDSDCEGK